MELDPKMYTWVRQAKRGPRPVQVRVAVLKPAVSELTPSLGQPIFDSWQVQLWTVRTARDSMTCPHARAKACEPTRIKQFAGAARLKGNRRTTA